MDKFKFYGTMNTHRIDNDKLPLLYEVAQVLDCFFKPRLGLCWDLLGQIEVGRDINDAEDGVDHLLVGLKIELQRDIVRIPSTDS